MLRGHRVGNIKRAIASQLDGRSVGQFERAVRSTGRSAGFTVVELLVTLFVAAAFLVAGFQLYEAIIKDGGTARAQSIATNVAQDYLNRYAAIAVSPCSANPTALSNSPISEEGLSNAQVSVSITCPSNSQSSISQINVTLTYDTPQQTVQLATYTNSTSLDQPASCPTGFIPVPANTTLDSADPNGFCVMKYEAKNVSGVATSQAASTPWATISYTSAVTASAAACNGCHLITNAEWMAIAANVMSVASNWTGGAVGSGTFYTGHSDDSPASALAADTNDANGYSGTGNTAPSGQRRTLTLTNGQVIWDFTGNVYEWTSDLVQSSCEPTPANSTWLDWSNASINFGCLPSSFEPSAISATDMAYTRAGQNTGGVFFYASSDTYLPIERSGYYDSTTNAGPLSIVIAANRTGTSASIGFRVAD